MGLEAIAFFVDVIITGLCTLVASKMRTERLEWAQLMLILFVVTCVSLIPVVGYFVAMGLFVILLVRLTRIGTADAIWIVIIAKSMALLVLVFAGVHLGDDPMTFLTSPSHTISNFIFE